MRVLRAQKNISGTSSFFLTFIMGKQRKVPASQNVPTTRAQTKSIKSNSQSIKGESSAERAQPLDWEKLNPKTEHYE